MLQAEESGKTVTWDRGLPEAWSAVPRRPVLESLGPALEQNDRPLVIFDDGAAITGTELHDRIERFAGVLARHVVAGDRVLLWWRAGNATSYRRFSLT
ncbi:MAG: hypothetical protein ACTHKL_21120 [Streptosporangiaceae bacterium]